MCSMFVLEPSFISQFVTSSIPVANMKSLIPTALLPHSDAIRQEETSLMQGVVAQPIITDVNSERHCCKREWETLHTVACL